MLTEMHWVTAVQYARIQPDVSYKEWCNLYYDHLNPSEAQIEKACETALPILVRNNVIDPKASIRVPLSSTFHGMSDDPDTWPRRDDPNPRGLVD